VQSIVISVSESSVCLFVCLSVDSLSRTTFIFLYLLILAVTWSSDGSVMHYHLGYMDVMFAYNEGISHTQRQRVCSVQFTRWWQQSGVRQRCLVEIVRWQHRGRSLPSLTASC